MLPVARAWRPGGAHVKAHMNRDDPEVLDALARDCALGLLAPAAQRRFNALLQESAAAREALAAWQARVAALAAQVPPAQPPAGLRAGIEARLFGAAAPGKSGEDPKA